MEYVKPLFTSEGLYEYIVHKLSVQFGFEILATMQYCDKFSRTRVDEGIDASSGFWFPNTAENVLRGNGIIGGDEEKVEDVDNEEEDEGEMRR